MSLKAIGVERREAEHAVIEMAAHCTPVLPVGQCMLAVKQGYKTKGLKISYQTNADWLDVSPSEAEIVIQLLYASTQGGERRFFGLRSGSEICGPLPTQRGPFSARLKRLRGMTHCVESWLILFTSSA